MKLGIATDHNGVNEKKIIIEYLSSLGYEVLDLSENNYDTDDYPDFAKVVCEKVINNNIDFGILMCGTGIGMSITANKFKGIRCAKVSNHDEAILAREHNDANVVALSYKESIENLKDYIITFITTNASQDERHVRRVNKIKSIESENYEN